MANTLNGITNGLVNTYSVLASQYKDGVTAENIIEAQGQVTTSGTSAVNTTFASYLQNNFSTIDENGDGTISAVEMQNLTNSMSTQGLTKEQFNHKFATNMSTFYGDDSSDSTSSYSMLSYKYKKSSD